MKVWDNSNKQWLEPIAIFFGKENIVWRVEACIPGEDPLTDGWYTFVGDDLTKISISGSITHNPELMPTDG